jgi:hypothetical protein
LGYKHAAPKDGDFYNNSVENVQWGFSSGRGLTQQGRPSNRRRAIKTSKYIGVSRHSPRTWAVRVARKYVGMYVSEDEAARAYNEAALKMFGVSAKQNQIFS